MHLALDHILYAAPDLDRTMHELARIGGEQPAPGGRHVGMGTRNALLGLGLDTYLELIAPDPEQDGGAFASSIAGLRAPELHAWCVRSDDPDRLATAIEASGMAVTRRAMSRSTPDGGKLSWELLFAQDVPWGGAAPFFIAWGETEHPAGRLEGRLRLRQLEVLHPDAAALDAWLGGLGLTTGPGRSVRTVAAPAQGLRADLTGPRGAFALRGGAGGIRATG